MSIVRNFLEEGMASKILLTIVDKENVGVFKVGTFSLTSYTLGHLFQNLFFIHITEFSISINH